jgi:hypothetical protein
MPFAMTGFGRRSLAIDYREWRWRRVAHAT